MTAILAILLAPFAVLTAFFLVEVLAGLRRNVRAGGQASPASAVIVVPAHDEAAVIGETLQSLNGGARPEHAGAGRCGQLHRFDGGACPVGGRRSGRAARSGAPWKRLRACLCCRPSAPRSARYIRRHGCRLFDGLVEPPGAGRCCAMRRAGPAQSVNLLRPDRRAPPLVQLSNFAFVLKNLVRQRGLQKLAGTGAPHRDRHGHAVRALPCVGRHALEHRGRPCARSRPGRRRASANARRQRLRLERKRERAGDARPAPAVGRRLPVDGAPTRTEGSVARADAREAARDSRRAGPDDPAACIVRLPEPGRAGRLRPRWSSRSAAPGGQ